MDPVLSRFEALRDSIAAVYRAIADRHRFEERVVAPGCGW
jgi:hypothetical protein